MRFLCGNDTVAVAMRFAMKNGQICFSLRKYLAISPAIQKIASDCGCNAVVHLGLAPSALRQVSPSPQGNWTTPPSSHSPSLPTLPLPLSPTPGSVCNAPGGGRPRLAWGRGARAQGDGGKVKQGLVGERGGKNVRRKIWSVRGKGAR